MERKNPKQLRLEPEVAIKAEEAHRDYQSAFKTSMSFHTFGNMAVLNGLDRIHKATYNKRRQIRKRRKING